MSMTPSLKIVIVGNGFAATQSALALSTQLPDNVELTFVHTQAQQPHSEINQDYLYGSLSSPDAYKNNLTLNVSEPDVILNTNSSFSFGSSFDNWGNDNLHWMQCFHLPFPTEAGVAFHHFMTRHDAKLSDFLISAQAALLGRFAHPPETNPSSALSRAEYGYHFEPCRWSNLYLSKLDKTKLTFIEAQMTEIEIANNEISSISLSNGQRLDADLFIDCTGPKGELISTLASNFTLRQKVEFQLESNASSKLGPPRRSISSTANGWQMRTPLQDKESTLTMRIVDTLQKGDQANDGQWDPVELGQRSQAWVSNCLAIGTAAYVTESITPAPYILLNRDVERLLELIPIDKNMDMERTEYNRRFNNDVNHADLFHQALYWKQGEVGYKQNDLLDRKLTQFCHRGSLANYDLEPFNDEDWVIMHLGMNRIPKDYYKMADQISLPDMSQKLDMMRKGIAHLASQMPPHELYLQKFLAFLQKSNVGS